MLKLGDGLMRVDSAGADLKLFQDLYKMYPEEFIRQYDLTYTSVLAPEKTAHVVYVESDGTIGQLLSLQRGDALVVYAEERLRHLGQVTNSASMAFFQLVRKSKEVALFAATNSPFDSDDDSLEEAETTRERILQQVRDVLATSPDQEVFPVTNENTLLFQQL